jgi:hypothetical protein
VAYRHGAPELWDAVGPILASVVPRRGAASDADDALAWWALLAETSGPRAQRTTARNVEVEPWAEPPPPAVEGDGSALVSGPPTVEESLAVGTILQPQSASSVWAPVLARWTGRGVAAEARCLLGGRGHAAARVAVRDDASSRDPVLQAVAERCADVMGPGYDPE